ncbi:helix-turn-helix domain-containing protein [Nocardioides KLBMP 9356]|uniref:Helix-turn-helix domain-containing protein n=1 Tax=Nocardioides potassii TaxID=2911371 RepID=A0ABS9HCR9_9ACTN|nr:helix-turn-helix domain-containing protein [Nocardioides potassii]MCF6378102.1 helix-turn-helix domain-containing protein [Nocardioides potassii]
MPSSPNPLPTFLTVEEVAYELRCTPRHVQNLLARGLLPLVKFGRSVRIPSEALLEIAATATTELTREADPSTRGGGKR